jgi:hypothetical protein
MDSEIDFKELYSSYTVDQLLDILQNADQYQPDAIAVAWEVAASKGWKQQLTEKLAAFNKEKQEEESEELNEQIEKARMINDNCTVGVYINDFADVQGALENVGIKYCTMEFYLTKGPDIMFYFFKEDFEHAKHVLGLLGRPSIDDQFTR